jgi:hypothetical protein
MSSDRQNHTLADYVALAIGPALIMGLVASLVFFLLNVMYVGEYVERMCWILFFFFFGAVLFSRITMLDHTSSRAALYGVPLGFLTWLGMQMFVEYREDSRIRGLSFLINAGLIGLIWWCAHRLTWESTNSDEETDVRAEGVLQAAGLEEQPGIPARSEETREEEAKPTASENWLQRWRHYREERNKKRTLGIWVVCFFLAALPLFGLGQALIPAVDVERRNTSFWLMVVYVGCGLSLLLTTCFLSLHRYLWQRRLRMPKPITSIRLTVSGLLLATLLLPVALLPRPNEEYSLLEWKSDKAEKYLDEREKAWFAFSSAQRGKEATQTTCCSCHSVLTYALARPLLRKRAGVETPTEQEKKLLDQTRMRVNNWKELDTAAFGLYYDFSDRKKQESWGTEAVLNTVILAFHDYYQGRSSPSVVTKEAFSHLWETQVQVGDCKGTWDWLDFNLGPWEWSEARYFGAALAAIAIGTAPGYYTAGADADTDAKVKLLQDYLKDGLPGQNLHNQVWGLWAAAKVEGVVSKTEQAKLVDQLLDRQQDDGGWCLASLGTWIRSDGSAQKTTSDGYATGLVLHALQTAGVSRGDVKVAKGLNWLKHNQSATGAWRAVSVNKKRDPDSHSGKFMSDAATAYAVLALSH